MKNPIIASLFFLGITPLLPAKAPEIDALIDKTVILSIPHIMAATTIANNGDSSSKDFSLLAKKITRLGLGEIPKFPAHWISKDEERNKRNRAELEERLHLFAQEDLAFLKSLDPDRDYVISEKEIRDSIQKKILATLDDKLKSDINKDNKLTIGEYALSVAAKSDEKDENGFDWHQRSHFEYEDKNKNGFIETTEMVGRGAETIVWRSTLIHASLILAQANTDGDNAISKEEFLVNYNNTNKLWDDISKDNKSIEISKTYTSLYWSKVEELKTIISPK